MGPLFADKEWREARERLARARNLEELEDLLVAEAASLSKALHENGTKSDREIWKELSVSVREKPMRGSGGHHESNGLRSIFVSKYDHRFRKRFTVAHEIAHLLLCSVPSQVLEGKFRIELLCDRFASEFLIPQDLLLKATAKYPQSSFGVKVLLQLCSDFSVNIQPMAIALSNHKCFGDFLLVLASRRGHPDRPEEIAYRIDVAIPKEPFFLPKDQRLESIGLVSLDKWLSLVSVGDSRSGEDEVSLKLWRRNAAGGDASGVLIWDAKILAKGQLLSIFLPKKIEMKWKTIAREKN